MTGRVRVGVSGWTYPHWRGDFYPEGLAHRRELAYASERMGALELNGSFYALQRPTSYARWREELADGVELAVKGSRFVTHLKRLTDVQAPLANFFASGLLALGDRLGPVLWQLPETLAFDAERVAAFLALLPRSTSEAAALAEGHDGRIADDRVLTTYAGDRPVRHAIEPRSPTWDTPEALAVLREHDVACVVADTAGRWPQLWGDTGPIRYVRLHGHTELYASGYSARLLDEWAARCQEWAQDRDVYVFFDNDARGRAPWDAVALIARLAEPDRPAEPDTTDTTGDP